MRDFLVIVCTGCPSQPKWVEVVRPAAIEDGLSQHIFLLPLATVCTAGAVFLKIVLQHCRCMIDLYSTFLLRPAISSGCQLIQVRPFDSSMLQRY